MDYKKRIEDYCIKHAMSYKEFAKVSGTSYATILGIMKGRYQTSRVITKAKIVKVLDEQIEK